MGQNLNVNLSIQNTLPTVNDVLPSKDWAFQGFPIAIWPGCILVIPVEFFVFSGNYTFKDIQGMANNSTSEYLPSVMCMEADLVNHFHFQPKSSEANLSGLYMGGVTSNITIGTYNLASNFTVNGYWDYPLTYSESGAITTVKDGAGSFWYPEVSPTPLLAFSPGTYTLAVEAEWGQVVILHFDVGLSQSSVIGSPLIIVDGSEITGNNWQFVSTTNGTGFDQGATVSLNSALVYVGNKNVTLNIPSPILVFKVESNNGSTVFSWYPPGMMMLNHTVVPGTHFSQVVNIATLGWERNYYTIWIYPEIFPDTNLTTSFNLA